MSKVFLAVSMSIISSYTVSDAVAQGAQRRGAVTAKPPVASAPTIIPGTRRPATPAGIGGPAAGARLATPGARPTLYGRIKPGGTPGRVRRPGTYKGPAASRNVGGLGGLRK